MTENSMLRKQLPKNSLEMIKSLMTIEQNNSLHLNNATTQNQTKTISTLLYDKMCVKVLENNFPFEMLF